MWLTSENLDATTSTFLYLLRADEHDFTDAIDHYATWARLYGAEGEPVPQVDRLEAPYDLVQHDPAGAPSPDGEAWPSDRQAVQTVRVTPEAGTAHVVLRVTDGDVSGGSFVRPLWIELKESGPRRFLINPQVGKEILNDLAFTLANFLCQWGEPILECAAAPDEPVADEELPADANTTIIEIRRIIAELQAILSSAEITAINDLRSLLPDWQSEPVKCGKVAAFAWHGVQKLIQAGRLRGRLAQLLNSETVNQVGAGVAQWSALEEIAAGVGCDRWDDAKVATFRAVAAVDQRVKAKIEATPAPEHTSPSMAASLPAVPNMHTAPENAGPAEPVCCITIDSKTFQATFRNETRQLPSEQFEALKALHSAFPGGIGGKRLHDQAGLGSDRTVRHMMEGESWLRDAIVKIPQKGAGYRLRALHELIQNNS